ncbi:oxidative stress-responsive serine-rich protein 1 [Protopterus annectens]|uniref:oxidative stress-responsive serine-rich protein 1 n=1 Tax=Protopterus annectens TaxID=7888 RepID=UPI001CFBD1B5|nr:oxidative stress-responsive serine-rich protein 1 [Protopterus annectens]
MVSESKDDEEENLQTAFKKLRVDPERCITSVCVSENASPRGALSLTEGVKPKTACVTKEIWHGPRKSSRGTARTSRRRRSKSPILHPPKFTFCNTKNTLPCNQMKQVGQAEVPKAAISAEVSETSEFVSACQPESVDATDYKVLAAEVQEVTCVTNPSEHRDRSSCNQKTSPEAKVQHRHVSDFQSFSQFKDGVCSCSQEVCHCRQWHDTEVYAFTGLRDVITEYEKNAQESHLNRTPSNTGASGCPRSCSEQARGFVDDVTIEDLAGYMEYYLYIPKKMSHMAEMMYT